MADFLTRGDHEEIALVWRQYTGGAVRDITNDTVTFRAYTADRPNAVAIVTKTSANSGGVVKTNAPQGECRVVLGEADLEGVAGDGTLYCYAQLRAADGKTHTQKFDVPVLWAEIGD